jgi:type IV secretory pathway VirB2 component (pilin)
MACWVFTLILSGTRILITKSKRGDVVKQTLASQLALKLLVRLEQNRSWVLEDTHMSHRKAFLMGAMVAALGDSALAGTATVANPMVNISKVICQIAAFLKGPIGLGIIIAMIVVAGLSFVTGGKKSSSILISALIGATIVFGARAVAGLVTDGGAAVGDTCVGAAGLTNPT